MADAIDGRAPWPLYLYGGVGGGKTCAALSLCDCIDDACYRTHRRLALEILKADKGQLYQSAQGGASIIRPEAIWERVRRAPLAVLDEVGMREKASDHAYEILYDWLEARAGKPSILIGNHDLNVVQGVYDERIASRINAGTLVQVAGKDLRDRRKT